MIYKHKVIYSSCVFTDICKFFFNTFILEHLPSTEYIIHLFRRVAYFLEVKVIVSCYLEAGKNNLFTNEKAFLEFTALHFKGSSSYG